MVITKTYQELKPVLMEPGKERVKEPYYIIDANQQSIFIVSPGQNGAEYNKTEGFLSNFTGVHTFVCLYGQGILLMQRNEQNGEAKEFKLVTLNAGRHVLVPAGWAMCMVNTGKNLLVVLGNVDINSKDLDSKPIFDKGGLAYFVVEKKGEIGFEQNPNYSLHPQITTE